MQRCSNGIFLKIGRIIRSGCFGSYFTTAMRENGRSCCGTGCHPGSVDGFKSLRNAGAALKLRPAGAG